MQSRERAVEGLFFGCEGLCEARILPSLTARGELSEGGGGPMLEGGRRKLEGGRPRERREYFVER